MSENPQILDSPQISGRIEEKKPEEKRFSIRDTAGDMMQGVVDDLEVESNVEIADIAFQTAGEATFQSICEAAFQAAGEAKAALVSEASVGLVGHGLHILAVALSHIS